jgi:hypothetical protein
MKHSLSITKTGSAQVSDQGAAAWQLEIPAGPAGSYRVAQLDSYTGLSRSSFPHSAPFQMRLRARASSSRLPGTWGFGLWNNPFGMALLTGKEKQRLPALPNTAWFFFASPENYLSLRDNLPANGGLAGVFRSARLPAALLLLGAPALPLLLLPPAARLLRRAARLLVKEDSAEVSVQVEEWHTYELSWTGEGVSFQVDGNAIHSTSLTPLGPLGFVLWIDNQYAAMRPNGKMSFGTLPNPEPAWIEVEELELTP